MRPEEERILSAKSEYARALYDASRKKETVSLRNRLTAIKEKYIQALGPWRIGLEVSRSLAPVNFLRRRTTHRTEITSLLEIERGAVERQQNNANSSRSPTNNTRRVNGNGTGRTNVPRPIGRGRSV